MNAIVRTAVAILCGFLAMTLVIISGTVVASTVLLPEGMRDLSAGLPASLPASYLAANLGLSALAAVFAGWLASRLDPHARWRPVIGLTVLMLVMSVANQAVPRGSTGGPVPWYPWALVAIGVAGTLCGGWLRLRAHRTVAHRAASTPDAAQSYS